MAKVKCTGGYPLWDIPDIDLLTADDSYRHVARNLYVSKKGYLVKYWTREEGLVEQRFSTADKVRDAYDVPKMKGDFRGRC